MQHHHHHEEQDHQMQWEIVYETSSDEHTVEEVEGKLSLDETWAFILSPAGHIALAVPAARVVSITALG
jgi:hypothetical protein